MKVFVVEYQKFQLGKLVNKSQRFKDEGRALELAYRVSEISDYPVQVKDVDSKEIIYWSYPSEIV
jgi:hypothetical protein